MAKTRKGGSPSQIPETRSRSSLKKGDMTESLGGSGTRLVGGFIEEDYNPSLTGAEGMLKFEKMRKSDAQVKASLMVCELPIRATEWYMDPARQADNTVLPLDQEISDFVAEALFERMSIPWDDYLHEILTVMPFGHSVFEKVYTADEKHVWLDKLASRKQTTILKWETEQKSAGITQYLPTPMIGGPNDGKSQVSIPSEKLLIFTLQREGDNLEGVSVLRSAYKHWYMKDNLYKFDVVKHERQGVGVPVLTMPENAAPGDEEKAKLILQKIRANEQGGIVLPFGWKFEYADTKAQTGSDMWKSIEHHNAMIAKNVLAMFMEIVGGEQGSRALSEDQSDFFLLALEAIARMIDEVHNRYLIPQLVDLNFENVEFYPKLAHKKLGNVDYEKIMTAISTGVNAGIVDPDFDLEVWIRQLMDLPPKMSPEDRAAIAEEEAEYGFGLDIAEVDENGDPLEEDPEEETIEASEKTRYFVMDSDLLAFHAGEWYSEELGEFRIVSEETKKKISESLKRKGGRSRIRVDGKKLRAQKSRIQSTRNKRVSARVKQLEQKATKQKNSPIAKSRISKAIKSLNANNKKYAEHTHALPGYGPSEWYRAYSEIFDNKRIIDLQNSFERDDLPRLREKGFLYNDYENDAWRGLTFAERKVNLSSLQKALEKADEQLTAKMGEATAKMKEDLLAQVKRAVDNDDIAAVGKIKAKYTGELASALTEVQKSMFDKGKQSAAAEMTVQAPATRTKVKGVMQLGNDQLAEKLAQDMESAAILSVTQVAQKKGGDITATGVAEAVGAAAASIDKIIEASAELKTLTIIGALNTGRAVMFERFPELIYGFQFSAILDGKTTDTCLSLDGRVVKAGSPDFYTYAPPRHYNCRSIWVEILNDEEFKPDFNDIPSSVPDNATIDVHKEMKAPEVKPGSSAAKVLQAELEDRKAKLQQLEESGKYPNRQESHKARIAELEKSIDKSQGSFSANEVVASMRDIMRADGIRFREDNV